MAIDRNPIGQITGDPDAALTHVNEPRAGVDNLKANAVDREDGKVNATSITIKDNAGSGDAGDRAIEMKLTDALSKFFKWKNADDLFRLEDQAGALEILEAFAVKLAQDPINPLEATTKQYVDAQDPFKNYFGDKSDGDLTTSGDVTLTSTEDGAGVVKNYGNLTISSGHTLTVSNRCKGLFLYVDGDLTVNGTIDMRGKGASATGQEAGISKFDAIGSGVWTAEDSNQKGIPLTEYPVPASGGAGGSGGSNANGSNGTAGTGGKCGGGGGGGGQGSGATGGAGGTATSYSGGPGGGGRVDSGTAGSGSNSGGAGGNGSHGGSGNRFAGGGAGNPAGTDSPNGTGSTTSAAQSGTGGLLIIVCSGNVTVGASGIIRANGRNGGSGDGGSGSAAGGGGSGGGSIIILHGGTYTNNGTVQANGGSGGTATATSGSKNGGNGGAGSIQIAQIEA